jgi:thiol-disulfide isomerase/thioredoxin
VNEPKKKPDRVSMFFVVALLLGAALMGWQEVIGQDVIPPGTPAPAFAVERLEGPAVSLGSLKGQVVVVNFWATWCRYCLEEMPYLISTVQSYESKGVTLLAMNTDDVDLQRAKVAQFHERFPQIIPYSVLSRPEIGEAYEVKALPSVYVINRHGQLSASLRGQATESQLKRWIEKALEE